MLVADQKKCGFCWHSCRRVLRHLLLLLQVLLQALLQPLLRQQQGKQSGAAEAGLLPEPFPNDTRSLLILNHTSCAHASANAHGDHAELSFCAPKLW